MWHSTRTAGSRCGGAGVLVAWNHPVSENRGGACNRLGLVRSAAPYGEKTVRENRPTGNHTVRRTGLQARWLPTLFVETQETVRENRATGNHTIRRTGLQARWLPTRFVETQETVRENRATKWWGGAGALAARDHRVSGKRGGVARRFGLVRSAPPYGEKTVRENRATGKRRSGRTVLRGKDGPGEPSYGKETVRENRPTGILVCLLLLC